MSITRRIISNFIWSIISEAIGKGGFFIANIYLARRLGVENFGLFSFAQAITFYFWLAVDLGTNMYGIREIAKNKDSAESIVNPLLTIRLCSGLLVFLFYAFTLMFFNMPSAQKFTFLGCGLYLLTFAFYTDWVFKGLEKFNLIAFGTVISSFVFLSGIFLLVKSGEDAAAAAFAWSVSFFAGGLGMFLVLNCKLNIKYRPIFNLTIWIFHLKESIHFTIAGVLSILFNYLPIFLLGIFFSKHDIGIFSAPYRTITFLSAPGFLIATAIYPTLSELYNTNKDEFIKTGRKFLVMMIFLGLSVGCAGSILGDKVIMILYGPQYGDSVSVFRILIWLLPLQFVRYNYSTCLRSAGYQKYQIPPVAIAIISFIIIALVSPCQLKNIALTVVLSEAVLVAGYIFVSKITYISAMK